MEDFDLDLIDELCSSFCTPSLSQKSNDSNAKTPKHSSAKSNRKRTSTMNPPETSTVKKIRLSDVTNHSIIYECDELSTLDESALQMLVRGRMFSFDRIRMIFFGYFSVKIGNHDHSFRR